MAVLEAPRPDTKASKSLFISDAQMEEFRAIAARQFEDAGIEYDPTATAEDSRQAFLKAGIRPEENFLSRGIVEAREE